MDNLLFPYGFIYETTCIPNSMKYIGRKIRTQNVDDPDDSWYIGSSCNPRFWEDLKLYGKDNFSRAIIENIDGGLENLINREEYYLKQVDAANNPSYYNRTNSGKCGRSTTKGWKWMTNGTSYIEVPPAEFDYYLSKGFGFRGEPKSNETKINMRVPKPSIQGENHYFYGKGYMISGENNPMYGKHHKEETRQSIGMNLVKYYNEHPDDTSRLFKSGDMHWTHVNGVSKETRLKMSKSQENLIHINKQGENTKVPSDMLNDYLNDGWELGYVYKLTCKNCGNIFISKGSRSILCNDCKER